MKRVQGSPGVLVSGSCLRRSTTYLAVSLAGVRAGGGPRPGRWPASARPPLASQATPTPSRSSVSLFAERQAQRWRFARPPAATSGAAAPCIRKQWPGDVGFRAVVAKIGRAETRQEASASAPTFDLRDLRVRCLLLTTAEFIEHETLCVQTRIVVRSCRLVAPPRPPPTLS